MTDKGAAKPAKVIAEKAEAVNDTAKKVSANPWLMRATRLGYVVRGCLYLTVGVLAVRAATGWRGDTEDLRGSLVLLPAGPLRFILLLTLIIGLAAYGLWGFIRAIYDPLHRGSDVAGAAARIGFAWSGFNYTVMVIFAVTFLVGTGSGDGADNIYKVVSKVMAYPAGWIVLTIAGAVGTFSGLGQFVDAYKAGFKKDLKRDRMSKPQRTAVDNLGRFGMVSRGVVFTLMGWFIFQAGLAHDVGKAQNMRGVFRAVDGLPLGPYLLALVGCGLIALALHSCACAYWVRMPTNHD